MNKSIKAFFKKLIGKKDSIKPELVNQPVLILPVHFDISFLILKYPDGTSIKAPLTCTMRINGTMRKVYGLPENIKEQEYFIVEDPDGTMHTINTKEIYRAPLVKRK